MSLPISPNFQISQGTCYIVDMNPGRRSKPGKVRPVVVLQATDIVNAGSPGVVVVPCTTQLRDKNILRCRLEPSTTLKLEKASDVLLDQIHTIDRTLFIEEVGPVKAEDFKRIQDGIFFLLGK